MKEGAMTIKKLFFLGILLLAFLTACSQTGESNVIFRDDFDGGLAEGWQWGNEDPSRWTITDDGWLSITASDATLKVKSDIIGMVNVLYREAPQGDFSLTSHLDADPQEDFQQAAIYLIRNGENYVAINTSFCAGCVPETGGYGIFMEAVKDNHPMLEQLYLPRDPSATDLYLRLVYSSQANTITGYYALKEGDWQQAFVVQDAPPFDYVALGATNAPGPHGVQNDLVAKFDWIEVSAVNEGSP